MPNTLATPSFFKAMAKHTDVEVKLNGTVVNLMCVIGFAVEAFLALAIHPRKGFARLAWHHVQTVTLRGAKVNDRTRQELEVDVPREAAELALRVAKAVCFRLTKAGFLLLDAIRSELEGGYSVGEHDLIASRMQQDGLSSIEVKLRTVKKNHYMPTVRRQVQNLAYKLWPAATGKTNHGWSERVVVLVHFADGRNQDWETIYCESLALGLENKPENWKPEFGWEARLPSLQMGAPGQHIAPQQSQQQLSARSQPPLVTQPPVSAPQERQRKRAFETLYGGVRKVDLYNKEMGSISDLLGSMATPAAKRAKPTIGEKLRGWAVRFRWPAHSWAQTPRLGSKTGGGKGGYAASKQALDDIHRHLDK